MKTPMNKTKIDHVILQEEADKLLRAIGAYRKTVLERAPSISANFQVQAQAMDNLVGNFVDSLQSIAGKTIIDILNTNNYIMLTKPWDEGDFGHEPLDDNHQRFIDLTDRTYEHVAKKGFMGEQDEKKTAKKILRDYVDATVMYYSIIRKKQGAEVSPIMIEGFVRKAHEFISEDRGNVVGFPPGGNRPK